MQLPSESAVTLRDDWGVNDLIAYLCRSQRSRIVVLLSARQRQTTKIIYKMVINH